MKESYLPSKNIYYRTNDFVAGRPTLVFVHGLSGSSSAWDAYEKTFENICNILSFDMRGHGLSWKPKGYESYRIEDFADDLHEIAEYLHIEKYILIGHSLGSLVVLAFLMKYQDEVEKVIFLAANYNIREMNRAKLISPFIATGISILKRLPFPLKIRGHIDYALYPNSGDWNIPRMFADIKNTNLRVYLYATKQSYNFDGSDFLEEIHLPTLIIHGENDTIFPVERGRLMAEKIKGSKFVILEDADHILVLNKPREISDEIKKFVFGTK